MRTDGQTDMTKLIVAFCNFAYAPKRQRKEEKYMTTIFSSILLNFTLRHVSAVIKRHHQAYLEYVQKECLHTTHYFPPRD
jgi:hypothetical protein